MNLEYVYRVSTGAFGPYFSSSSTGRRVRASGPYLQFGGDPVRIKYTVRGLRSRDHWFSSCVPWWAPDRAGDAKEWRRQRWHCWWVCGIGVSASFLLSSFFPVSVPGEAFWMAFLQWLMPRLSSPLPLLVWKRCSCPAHLFSPCSARASLDAGLSSTKLILHAVRVECVRGGVQGGVAFVTRPLGSP